MPGAVDGALTPTNRIVMAPNNPKISGNADDPVLHSQPKKKYEPPLIVPLGELARGAGAGCSFGGSAFGGGSNCKTGGTAGLNCITGTTPSQNCNGGGVR